MCKSYDNPLKLFCSTVMYVCHSEATACSLSAMPAKPACLFDEVCFVCPSCRLSLLGDHATQILFLIADLVTHVYGNCLQAAICCAQDIYLAAFGIRQILLAVLLFLFTNVPNSIICKITPGPKHLCPRYACPQLRRAGFWHKCNLAEGRQEVNVMLATVLRANQAIHPTTGLLNC